MRKLMKIDATDREEIRELLKEPITAEMIEKCPVYQESQQAIYDILEEYDNDYEKYLDDLMAEPREPGVKYVDKPPVPAWLNWITEKMVNRIRAKKMAEEEQDAFDNKLHRKELAIGK